VVDDGIDVNVYAYCMDAFFKEFKVAKSIVNGFVFQATFIRTLSLECTRYLSQVTQSYLSYSILSVNYEKESPVTCIAPRKCDLGECLVRETPY
jgi:hypothetical protein